MINILEEQIADNNRLIEENKEHLSNLRADIAKHKEAISGLEQEIATHNGAVILNHDHKINSLIQEFRSKSVKRHLMRTSIHDYRQVKDKR